MKSFSKIIKSVSLSALLLVPGVASALEGQTLGLPIGYPLIDASPDNSLECGYDGATLSLQSKATQIELTSGGNVVLVFAGTTPTSPVGGLLDISAQINSSGVLNLIGSTVTVTGAFLDGSIYGDGTTSQPLLTGDITDFGIQDGGQTDVADFKITVTGGDLLTHPDWPAGSTETAVAVDLVNSGYTYSGGASGFSSLWDCDSSKSSAGPIPGGNEPFECYSVNKVTLWDKSGTTDDQIKIEKSGFRFPPGETFDPATDDVVITIDGLILSFPAGSFDQNGSNLDYTFSTASGVNPKITVRLNVEKRQWELKLTDGDLSLIDNSDGIDITLSIGDFESTENVVLSPKGNKLSYSANPFVSCNTNDDGMKLSCIASMTVQHSLGALITKSTAEGTLLHRDTVFDDPGTGDIGIFHTSCSECLMCGDTSGNFTIVEISSLPGDNLSDVCGVPDASCSTLP